jgi:hypothetical protein
MSGSGGVKIPVSAQLDAADIQALIAKLTSEINRMGTTIASANKMKFNPIDKAAVEDIKRVAAGFESLKRTSAGLNQRIKATGQQSTGFFDLDWNKLYSDPAARNRRGAQAFEYVTGRGFESLPTAPNAPPVAPIRPVPPAPRHPRPPGRDVDMSPPGQGGFSFPNIAREGLGGALSAAGPVGGLANRALSAGGLGSAVGGFMGGALALLGGAIIGGVKEKIGQAGQENIGYDTLKRQLGDLGVGFDMLKGSLRAASSAISVTFEDAQRMGGDFARIGGLKPSQSDTLADEVGVGGGFGRSFGIDPSRSNAFFASARGLGLTSNTDDTRRLGLLIGEGIAKTGVFARSEEFLQAVASFAGNQTRTNLTPANVSGYTGMLSSMLASGIPGMDIQGSTSILSRANSAIMGGGAAGEAGQNFLYSALGKRLGLNPLQTMLLQEQGAFGTGEGTFGAKSNYANYMGGSYRPPSAAISGSTNLQLVMDELQKVYGGDKMMMANAGSRVLGLSMEQFMGLQQMKPAELGGLGAALTRNRIDLKTLNPTSYSALAQISTGGHGVLMEQAASLRRGKGRNALSTDESGQLNDAIASQDDGKLRDVLLKLSASRGQEQTEGSRTRDSIQELDKTFQTFAEKMVPLTNTMRDALVLMAGGGKMTARGIGDAVREGEVKEADGDFDGSKKLLDDKYTGLLKGASPQDRMRLQKSYEGDLAKLDAARNSRVRQIRTGSADMDPSTAAANKQAMLPYLYETDQLLGLPKGTSAAQIDQESGFQDLRKNPSGASGIAQFTDDTWAEVEQRLGRKLDRSSPMDNAIAQREQMRMLKEKFGGDYRKALRGYNGGANGEGTSHWNNAENRGYVPSIEALRHSQGYDIYTPVPNGAVRPQASNTRVTGSGEFVLKDQRGNQLATATAMLTTVSRPSPFGMSA